jgi:hypothetical protein
MTPSRPDQLAAGGSPALLAVAQLNQTVAGRARQGYTAQGLCAAIAAAALAISLAVLGGAELGRVDLLALAVILGVMTLLMWRRANLRSDEAVARCVDEELGLRGAYLAAFEAGRGGAPSVMSELGAERLLGKVRRREVVEAATPHTVGFAALPFGAVALLVVCVGMGDSSGRPGQGDRARSFALSSDLSALARDGAEQMDDAAREGLERAAAAAAGAAAGSGSEEMREVAEELEALALEAPPGSELAEALSRAAAAAESMSLEAGAEDPELDAARQLAEGADSTERRALGEDRGSAPGTGGEGPAARSVEQGAAGADGSGVPDSPGSQAPADGDPSGGEPDSGAPAEESSTRAVLELNWWEPRDEGLVSRWVALQRASATPSQSGQ